MRQRAMEAKLIKDLAEEYQIDPQTISDVILAPKPEPQAPTPKLPKLPKDDEDDEDEDNSGDEPEPDEPDGGEVAELETDCGTGAGGFKPGNTCAKGGGEENAALVGPKLKEVLTSERGDRFTKFIWHNLNAEGKNQYADAYEKTAIAYEKTREELLRSGGFRAYNERNPSGTTEEKLRKYHTERFNGLKKSVDSKLTPEQYNKIISKMEESGGTLYDEVDLFVKQYGKNNKIANPEDNKYWKKYRKNNLIPPGLVPDTLSSLNNKEIEMLIAGMMGGIELGKYDGIDFTPPEGAREAAKRALDVREKKPASQKGMTAVGLARARDLIKGVKFSPDTVRRMKAFFDRHEVDKKGSTWDEKGKGWQAWNGWGGDAGYAWARKVVGQMEARDKRLSQNPQENIEFLKGRDCGQTENGTFGPKNECAVGYGRPKEKGGYDPIRPGGKWPPGYKVGEGQTKEDSKKAKEKLPSKNKKPLNKDEAGHQYDEDGNIIIPKYQLNDRQKAKKAPTPEKGDRILNDKADRRDWNQYRDRQLKEDPEAVWKVGEVKMKGDNLSFEEWEKAADNDIAALQVRSDFKGSEYTKLNPNPETKASQTLLNVMKKQAPHKQTEPMWRGLSFKTQQEADNFVGKLKGDIILDRTLTSFTTDENTASTFTAGSVHGSLYLKLTKSKSLRKFSDSEKEFVLPYKSRLRVVGKPKTEMVGRNKNIKQTIIEIEEY
jgi:hypothetical protein